MMCKGTCHDFANVGRKRLKDFREIAIEPVGCLVQQGRQIQYGWRRNRDFAQLSAVGDLV
jgi:hypothetical protein